MRNPFERESEERESRRGPRGQTVMHRLPPREVVRTTLLVVGVVVAVYLLWLIQEVLVLLLLAIMLAIAIEPVVNYLRRGPFTRGSGVLAVYSAVVIAIGLPLFLLAPSFAEQSNAFTENLPERVSALRAYAAQLQPRPLRDAAVTTIDRAARTLRYSPTPPDEKLVEVGATAAHTIVRFVTVFVLAFYWLQERAAIKRGLLRLVRREYAREVNTIWIEVEEKLGGWVRGQLVLRLAVFAMAGAGYWLIGVPNSLVLAAIAAVIEMIPLIGPVLAYAPAVLIMLAVDPPRAVAVVGLAVLIELISGNILLPRVLGRTVGISPLTVILGFLTGSVLYGIPGALLAVPIAGAVQVILSHTLRLEDPAQAEAHTHANTASLIVPDSAARPVESLPDAAAGLTPISARQAQRRRLASRLHRER